MTAVNYETQDLSLQSQAETGTKLSLSKDRLAEAGTTDPGGWQSQGKQQANWSGTHAYTQMGQRLANLQEV